VGKLKQLLIEEEDMNREHMIKELTKQELYWVFDNDSIELIIDDITEFFSKGGFNTWTDEQLTIKYNRDILENV
jgi:sucrose-6-phosphate hydrolase SacC (GH32 family)